MRKLLLIALVTVMSALSSNAQISLGPEIGLNISKLSISDTFGLSYNNKSKTGLKIGALMNIEAGKRLSLQTGIYYTMKGGKQEVKALGFVFTADYRTNFLEIPLNVQYNIVDAMAVQVFLGAGPYVAYSLTGKVQIKGPGVSEEEDLRIGTDSTDNMDPSELGINIYGGIMVSPGFFVRMQYGLGLTNLSAAPSDIETVKGSTFCISAGYLFGRRR